MNEFKTVLIDTCSRQIAEKMRALEDEMKALTEAAENDSKSTAGDKHETARAMVQLEQERMGKQLKEAQEQAEEFHRIDFKRLNAHVVPGALVQTAQGNFLIAIALGKVVSNGRTVFVISPQSPLGKAFQGLALHDRVSFNGVSYEILSIA